MKILITGGSGFIGSHLLDRLAVDKHKLFNIDILHPAYEQKGRFRQVDIRHKPSVDDAIASFKPHAVVHLAAQTCPTYSVERPEQDLITNGLGFLNVIEAAKENDVQRFVYASSAAVYGDMDRAASEKDNACPDSPLGISKLLGERYAKLYGCDEFKTLGLRLSNVYGPRASVNGECCISGYIGKMMIEEPYTIQDENSVFDFLHIYDLVDAIVAAVTLHDNDLEGSDVVNVGTGQGRSLGDVNRFLRPLWVEMTGKKPRKPIDAQRPPEQPFYSVLNTTKAEELLFPWRPTVDLYQGIKDTLEWTLGGCKK